MPIYILYIFLWKILQETSQKSHNLPNASSSTYKSQVHKLRTDFLINLLSRRSRESLRKLLKDSIEEQQWFSKKVAEVIRTKANLA